MSKEDMVKEAVEEAKAKAEAEETNATTAEAEEAAEAEAKEDAEDTAEAGEETGSEEDQGEEKSGEKKKFFGKKNKKDKKTALYISDKTTFLKGNLIKIVSHFIFYTVFQHFFHLIRNCETQTQPNQYFCNKQTTYNYEKKLIFYIDFNFNYVLVYFLRKYIYGCLRFRSFFC